MKKFTAIITAALILAGLNTITHAQVGAKKSGDPRVAKILMDARLKYTVDSDGDFVLSNTIDNDRTQICWVLSRTSNLGSLEIRQVWAIAYRSRVPLSSRTANRLLEQNANVKLGSWQVRKMGDDHVAVFVAQIAADADPVSLLTTLQAVTSTADEMEYELTERDDF